VLDVLDGAALARVVASYRDALRAHQEELNRLNVYPVPDGDTGTNMALTVESVVAELAAAEGGGRGGAGGGERTTTSEMQAVCAAGR